METQEKDRARLARAILRVVQNQPGVGRTFLTAQTRAYGPGLFDVLDELIRRGLIIETPKIVRQKSKNRRAVLTYTLAKRGDWPEFDNIDYQATGDWLVSIGAPATSATTSEAHAVA